MRPHVMKFIPKEDVELFEKVRDKESPTGGLIGLLSSMPSELSVLLSNQQMAQAALKAYKPQGE